MILEMSTILISAWCKTDTIACTSHVDWGFVVLELATSLTYDTMYVEMYHCYIFVWASYWFPGIKNVSIVMSHPYHRRPTVSGAKGRLGMVPVVEDSYKTIRTIHKRFSLSRGSKARGITDTRTTFYIFFIRDSWEMEGLLRKAYRNYLVQSWWNHRM
jgi:hypothetical protein